MQPVSVVDDDRFQHPGFDVVEHPQILRPTLAAVGADVRIEVPLHHRPAATLGQLLAVGQKLAALNRATALVPFIADAKRVREQWQTMTLSRQHQIVAALLDHVVVGPARRGYNRFDESRLPPVWRV